MNKQLLNKILPYCGHGLKVAYEDSIVNAELANFTQMCKPSGGGEYFKPVLFPPDCLNREIETEHGKEVLLIEMAKISGGDDKTWEIAEEYDRIYVCKCCLKNGISHTFAFLPNICDFVSYSCKNMQIETSQPSCQWQLFQYLYSRHIAFNLEPDEYISVESLEKNPYATKQ